MIHFLRGSPTGRAARLPQARFGWPAAVALTLAGCTSVPGESLISGGAKRDASARVLAQANAAEPGCKRARITDTEVVELHPDGKVALERWTVDQCGRRVRYQVTVPAVGKGSTVLVRPE